MTHHRSLTSSTRLFLQRRAAAAAAAAATAGCGGGCGGGGYPSVSSFVWNTNNNNNNKVKEILKHSTTTTTTTTPRPNRYHYTTNTTYHRSYSSVTSKADRIQRVMAAKQNANLSYDDLAKQLNVTNTYAAQLVLGQAKLTFATAQKLQQALPTLSQEDIQDMMDSFPMRSFDDEILKEPNVYRTYEAITHYGEAIKAIINEQCGDGIMSAIDFYCDVGTTTGKKHGEKRVVITFNGKFLPFIEQVADDNGAKSPRE